MTMKERFIQENCPGWSVDPVGVLICPCGHRVEDDGECPNGHKSPIPL